MGARHSSARSEEGINLAPGRLEKCPSAVYEDKTVDYGFKYHCSGRVSFSTPSIKPPTHSSGWFIKAALRG
jgi:hypothetical protein